MVNWRKQNKALCPQKGFFYTDSVYFLYKTYDVQHGQCSMSFVQKDPQHTASPHCTQGYDIAELVNVTPFTNQSKIKKGAEHIISTLSAFLHGFFHAPRFSVQRYITSHTKSYDEWGRSCSMNHNHHIPIYEKKHESSIS